MSFGVFKEQRRQFSWSIDVTLGLILDISSPTNSLPSSGNPPPNTLPSTPTPQTHWPRRGLWCGPGVCVRSGRGDRYNWILSPWHLELGRIKVRQSLWSSVTREAMGKVMCSPLQPDTKEAGQQGQQQGFRAESCKLASWSIHHGSQLHSILGLQETFLCPYHTFYSFSSSWPGSLENALRKGLLWPNNLGNSGLNKILQLFIFRTSFNRIMYIQKATLQKGTQERHIFCINVPGYTGKCGATEC